MSTEMERLEEPEPGCCVCATPDVWKCTELLILSSASWTSSLAALMEKIIMLRECYEEQETICEAQNADEYYTRLGFVMAMFQTLATKVPFHFVCKNEGTRHTHTHTQKRP